MTIELSELQAIDFALGAHIVGAFTGHNKMAGPKQWREFLTRADGKKVWRTEADSPSDFLKQLAASGKNEAIVNGKIVNLPPLPCVYYFRKPGMSNGADNRSFAMKNVWDDNLLNAYSLTRLPVILQYTLVFAAWDKPALDKMQLAWYAYLLNHKRFVTPVGIDGGVFDVPAWILDPKTMMFADISIPKGDGRLFAVEATVEIETMVLYGNDITESLPTGNAVTLEGVWLGYSCSEFQLLADPMTEENPRDEAE